MATTGRKTTSEARSGRNGHNGARSGKAPQNDNTTALFDALAESAQAFFSASKASSDRAYRLSQGALSDAQATQRDLIALAQKWAESPLDLLGWYTAITETAVHAQHRTAEGARRLWEELADARKETQEAFQRSARANWRAGQAAFGLARGAITKSS